MFEGKSRRNMEANNMLNSLDQTEQPHAEVCGFWKRIFAMMLDGILLGLFGALIGFVMFDQLARLGGWGRLAGFSVALIYFGVFNSVVGNGQTPGKRMMKIRVIDHSGNYISLAKSFLRFIILGLPFFLNQALIPTSVMMSPVGYILSLLIFGFGTAIVYLYVFNRRTRQSLHDIVAGTFVTTAISEGPAIGSVWKPHLVVTGLLLVIAISLPVLTGNLSKKWEFPELLEVQKSIISNDKVLFATVNAGKSWGTNNGEKWEKTYFQTAAIMKAWPNDPESSAQDIAQIVLKTYPPAMEKDIIAINTTYGYDIGIAHAWRTYNVIHTPEEWQQLIARLPREESFQNRLLNIQ